MELWEVAQCGMGSALCEAGDGTLCEESESWAVTQKVMVGNSKCDW